MTSKDGETLFGRIPADAFRLLSGSARGFYAALLTHLGENVLGSGGLVPRLEFMDALRSFCERWAFEAAEHSSDGEGDDGILMAAADGAARASIACSRLLATGWLVEHRDRYRRTIDLHPGARTLLDLLVEMAAGRTRSYGGEVLQILTQMEAARNDPEQRSEALRNAARASRSFLNHLATVASAMRRAEDEVLRQGDLTGMFRAFFEDFVTNHMVEDFKSLRTESNPFRFKGRILDIADLIAGDDIHLSVLADAYVRERRAPSREVAMDMIMGELFQVQDVFSQIDERIDAIEDTGRRVEIRVANAVRHRDRVASARSEILASVFRGLAELPGDMEIPFDARETGLVLPVGGEHLFRVQARRPPAARKVIARAVRDPADIAHDAAMAAYARRALVTHDRLAEFLDRCMAGRTMLRASEIAVDDLDTFFVFERLRAAPFMADGKLAGRFEIRPADGLVENAWIACHDFTIVAKDPRRAR